MPLRDTLFQAGCATLKAALRLLGPHTGPVIATRLAEQLALDIAVQTPAGRVRLFCPGHIPFWNAEHLLDNEPGTLAWIDTFRPGDIFWDIGANIGTFTLYAALHPGVRVCAFEPSAHNYHILSRNIAINQLGERVAAYCLALCDRTRLDTFYLCSDEVGHAEHAFGAPLSWRDEPFTAASRQAAIGFAIDEFVDRFAPPFPSHLKIDVDGIEDAIIRGAARTLADPRLRTLLVELNINRGDHCREVIALLAQAGLALQSSTQVYPHAPGQLDAIYNHLFVRR